LAVYPTVFEILTFKAIGTWLYWLVFPAISCSTVPLVWNPLEFQDETYPAKTRGM